MFSKPVKLLRFSNTRLLLISTLALAAPPVIAADSQPAPAAKLTEVEREKILEAVDHLGSADPTEREAASKFLSSQARQAEPLLAEAAKGDDAEVAARAGMLLRRIHAGVNSDTPRVIVDRVAEYEDAGDGAGKLAAANKLLQTPEATPILVRLWASEPNANIRAEVGQLFKGRAREMLPPLLAAGAEDAVRTLLQNDAPLSEAQTHDYIAYLLLTRGLDDAIAKLGPPEGITTRPGGWMLLAKGDTDAARGIAERIKDDRLLHAAQYAGGDWRALAAFYDEQANRPAASENAMFLSAAFHSMAGDDKALDADLQRITRVTRNKGGNPFISAEVFLLVGRVDEAIEMLKPANATIAFDLLCDQMRFDEAFALLDPPPRQASDRFSLQLAAARWYQRLGRKEDALKSVDEAQRAWNDQPEPRGRPGSLAALQWALDLKSRAVALVDATNDPRTAAALVGDIFGARHSEAELFWPVMQKLKPGASTAALLDQMELFLTGRSTEKEVRVIADAAQKNASLTGPADSSRQFVWIARTLSEYGLDAEAEKCLQRVPAQAAAADGYLTLGDRAARQKNWPDAARLYETAAEASGNMPIALYLRGWALTKSGNADEGAALIRRARLLPLSGEERGNLMRGLVQRGLRVEADEEAQLLLKLHDFWSSAASEAAQRRTRVLAEKGNFSGAVDSLQRGMLMVFRTEGAYVSESAYLDAPRQRDELRARDLFAHGKADEGAAILRRAAERYPVDVDWAIKVVRSLEKDPATKPMADELFTISFQRHAKLLEANPKAFSFHNGLAWLCARTGRQLDAALKHAELAVASDPDNAAYLDTLAETHFRRGDNAKALDLAKRCVELTPRSAYFKSNLKRFAGDKAEENPDAPASEDGDDSEPD